MLGRSKYWLSDGVNQILNTGLAIRGLVLVDNALGGSLIQRAVNAGSSCGSGLLIASLDGGVDVLDEGLELGANRLVANASDLIGADALLLRLDVCHL